MTSLLVIGTGVAGLTAALKAHAMPGVKVTVVTKDSIERSNTAWAQGGVAVVTDPADSVAAHVADTLAAGAGLSVRETVEILCSEGPAAITGLIEHGVEFDRVDGELARGLEAAHSHARILHGGGDATGAAIAYGLIGAARERGVSVLEKTTVVDLVVESDRVVGVRLLDGGVLTADAIILATGGAGQLFGHTTNPGVATGDGVAMALRAGVIASDLEFFQFHPTSLDAPGNPLVSEAVRGEGGQLIDVNGDRFMLTVHPDAELAPRDVVARAIAAQMRQDGQPVRLDVRHLGREFLAQRFPTIDRTVRRLGWDWATEPVPVTPAAHYYMGGIRTDADGRTSLSGLYAVGEVACNGLHGANRLASNSLLEGAVFAHRVIDAALADASVDSPAAVSGFEQWAEPIELDLADGTEPFLRADLQQLMWDFAGLIRSDEGLRHAQQVLATWAAPRITDVKSAEDANLLTLARAVVACAIERKTSIGAHWRDDSLNQPGSQQRHSTVVSR